MVAEFDVLALTVQKMFRAMSFNSISRAARLTVQSAILGGLTLFSLGCGQGTPAEFKLRSTTEDLITDAEKAVKKTLAEGFGSPYELVAWERFPVVYGGVKGTVESIAENKSLVVKLDSEAHPIKVDSPILFISGSAASEKPTAKVASFDAEKNQLTVTGVAPAAGDRFIAGFGEQFQMGRQVYMRNCMHCHGVTGDGAGPTGEFLNPRPRDYRNGQFKFTSTKPGEKACRDDLHRIVKYGIPGTYMPSFLLLGENETEAVIEYIRWLAIRGEFEKRMVTELSGDYSEKSIADSVNKAKEAGEKAPSLSKAIKAAAEEFGKYSKEDYPAAVEETASFLADAWTRADEPDTVIVPSVQRVADSPESRERGRLLYMSDKTKCYTCHGMTGRGDGSATEDRWPKPGSTEKYDKPGLHDEWGFPLKPRNLTLGQYRGGRRPVDIFRRMYAGIKGTPMPAFGGTALKDEEIWDLVNFVMSLPYAPQQSTPAPGPGGHVAKVDEKPAH